MTFTIYDNAIGFANAFRLLFSKTSLQALISSGSYLNATMVMPTVVNGVLACELFIKALLDHPSKKHSILDLLDELENEKPGTKEQLQYACVMLMQQRKNARLYDNDKYNEDLGRINNAFVELRYWHEPRIERQDSVVCNLGFLDVFVSLLQGVCEQKYGPRPQTE